MLSCAWVACSRELEDHSRGGCGRAWPALYLVFGTQLSGLGVRD